MSKTNVVLKGRRSNYVLSFAEEGAANAFLSRFNEMASNRTVHEGEGLADQACRRLSTDVDKRKQVGLIELKTTPKVQVQEPPPISRNAPAIDNVKSILDRM